MMSDRIRRLFLKGAGSLALAPRMAAASSRHPVRDVVVLIPGLLGSVLQNEGRDLWAPAPGRMLAALATLGRSIEPLRLSNDSLDRDVLDDGVRAVSLFPDTHVIPGLWKIDGYSQTRDFLLRHLDLSPGANFFEFPYDWRRDNRATAYRLARASAAWLSAWRKQSEHSDARLILIAHSMGGLASLYFLEQLDGWRHTRALITLGTPFRGALKAADFLSNGIPLPIPGLPVADVHALLGTFSSIYQLLPRFPCVRAEGMGWKRIHEVNISGIDQARAREGGRFLTSFDEATARNRQRGDYATESYGLVTCFGTFQDTAWSARLQGGRLVLSDEVPVADSVLRSQTVNDGDGTVARVSAQPVEMPGRIDRASERPFPQLHASLQSDRAVLGQLLQLLVDSRAISRQLRGPAVSISLAVEDVYLAGTAVHVRARCSAIGSLLQAQLTSRMPGSLARPLGAKRDDGNGAVWDVSGLATGDYRVTVSQAGDAGGASVSDVFAVA